MKTVFADSYFYIALMDERDPHHLRVQRFIKGFKARIVTTTWVLTEVGAHFSKTSQARQSFGRLLDRLASDDETVIHQTTREVFEYGIDLYRQRHDKKYSVVDCISFVIMKRLGLSGALTHDHHFQQEGFHTLLTSSDGSRPKP